jgi:predicted PurR-regulated permease PerM
MRVSNRVTLLLRLAPQWSLCDVAMATLVALGVGLAFYLLYRFYMIAFLFLVAVVLATVVRPGVGWLQRLGVPEKWGLLLIYASLAFLLALLLWLIAPIVIDQLSVAADRVPELYAQLRASLASSQNRLFARLVMGIPKEFSPEFIISWGGQTTGGAPVSEALRLIGAGGRAVFVMTAVLVLAYYWTLEGEYVTRRALLFIPAGTREGIRDLVTEMEATIGAHFRGQMKLCLAVGGMSFLGYLALGLPYALSLALIMGFLEAVPLIGPTLGAIPAIIVTLGVAPEKVPLLILLVVGIQTVEGMFLVPRIMSRAVGVHAIVTILAITAFGALFGFAGALLAIPLAAIIQIVLNRIMTQTPTQQLGRSRASLLRLQTQEFIHDVRKLNQEDTPGEETADGIQRVDDHLEAIALRLDRRLSQLEERAP